MKKNELFKGIDGAILDLDGTLLDSAWVWNDVDRKFLGERGYEVPDDYFEAIAHLGSVNTAIYTKKRFHLKENIDEIVQIWIDMARDDYINKVMFKPYALDFIKKLHSRGIKMSIATSSDEEIFTSTLRRGNARQYFEAVVTVRDVKHDKGFPDIYQEAARRMGIPDDRCIVFEDILKGIRGAKAGGFRTVGVYDENSASMMKKMKEEADYYIMSFDELL